MKPNGKFSLILDALTAFAIVAIVLVSVATSALSLIFRPDREPWRVALDVVIVVVFIAVAIIATKVLRRALKNLDAEEAEGGLPDRPLSQQEIDDYNAAAAAVPVDERPVNPNLSPEYRAALDRIGRPQVIGPEDFPTETELQADFTRTKTGRVE